MNTDKVQSAPREKALPVFFLSHRRRLQPALPPRELPPREDATLCVPQNEYCLATSTWD